MADQSVELGTELPAVQGNVPGPQSKALAEQLSRYETPNGSAVAAGEVPVFWDISRGANLWDVDAFRGKYYVTGSHGLFFVPTLADVGGVLQRRQP